MRPGADLIASGAPDFVTEDTPSAVLIRQVSGAVAEFQKTDLVVKLRGRPRTQADRRVWRAQDLCRARQGPPVRGAARLVLLSLLLRLGLSCSGGGVISVLHAIHSARTPIR